MAFAEVFLLPPTNCPLCSTLFTLNSKLGVGVGDGEGEGDGVGEGVGVEPPPELVDDLLHETDRAANNAHNNIVRLEKLRFISLVLSS